MALKQTTLKLSLCGVLILCLCMSSKEAITNRKSTDEGLDSKALLMRGIYDDSASARFPTNLFSSRRPYRNKGRTMKDGANFEAKIDKTGVTVWLHGKQIYSDHDRYRVWAGLDRRFHAGVHVIVLHESRHQILQKGHFLTWQPASHRMLVKMLNNIQNGRIVILLGVPEFVSWLLEDAARALVRLLHARLGPMAVRAEAWAMIGHKGHRPIMETLITCKNDTRDVSPLWVSASIPTFTGQQCSWHKNPNMADRVFCDNYEGYGDFCRCKSPLQINPQNAPLLSKKFETIPVALVTAKRLPNVLNQIVQIWSNPGGSETPLAIMVDGYSHEAELLGKVLNVTVLFHQNIAKVGTKQRINQHIKFSLKSIFELYPDVDKAIILEDDLVLSPDFISYFQQTSILLKFDPTILCINAYNYNSFPHTAHDPSRLYRAQSYPYYGWMTNRLQANKLLENWATLDIDADWDLWVRRYHVNTEHQVIIPEVPRTKHEGGGGFHVSGFEQETTFHQRLLNDKQKVEINMIRLWDFAYALDLMRLIEHAVKVNITRHPCKEIPIPKYSKQTHVVYLNLTGEDDIEHSYKVVAKCLGFFQDLYENYQGTISIKFFETPLIIISCPSSPYCVDVPEDIIYLPSKDDIQYADDHPWRLSNTTGEISWRIPANDPLEEFNLKNTIAYAYVVNE